MCTVSVSSGQCTVFSDNVQRSVTMYSVQCQFIVSVFGDSVECTLSSIDRQVDREDSGVYMCTVTGGQEAMNVSLR